jgi:hypothetical protein
MALNERIVVNSELEIMWKQLSPVLRYCTSIYMEQLRTTTKTEYIHFLGSESNLRPPRHKAGMLTTQS